MAEVMSNKKIYLGVDVGTGGVRALAVTDEGKIVGRSAVDFTAGGDVRRELLHEQPTEMWWEALQKATGQIVEQLGARGNGLERLEAVSIDGTSGTVAFLDGQGRALRPGIMYNDGRAVKEAEELNEEEAFCEKLGYRFAASYGMAKILWVRQNEPEVFGRSVWCVHQADYLAGKLTGRFNVSDYSNALKTGYDLVEECWPGWVERWEGLTERLPEVVAPGTVIGEITAEAAKQTGLPAGLTVVAGASDGTAGCIASGVSKAGDFNTTLGTTLVLKMVSRRLCKHPDGLIYSHKLPGGYWLPGGASNTGGEWISALFGGDDLQRLDAEAAEKLPSEWLAYPLVRKGERFPFLRGEAEGFCEPRRSGNDYYAACLQGTALLERLAYEVLEEAVGTSDGEVFSTGGGSRSDVWTQCRTDVSGRVVHRPECPEAALGSAILAAIGAAGGDLWQVAKKMVRIERRFEPRGEVGSKYAELYGKFLAELRERGYL